MAELKLIVGLGNPGSAYEKTRHNAGFWFLDALADTWRCQFTQNAKMHGLLARLELPGAAPVWLLKPATFMNRSGQSVAALMRFYRLQPEQILVAHDELDFDAGVVRLKQGGGHGGHNGLRDIIAHVQSRDFYRLRIGIGHPGDRARVVQYVLGQPAIGERPLLNAALERAEAVVPELLQAGAAAAMNRLNTAAD